MTGELCRGTTNNSLARPPWDEVSWDFPTAQPSSACRGRMRSSDSLSHRAACGCSAVPQTNELASFISTSTPAFDVLWMSDETLGLGE